VSRSDRVQKVAGLENAFEKHGKFLPAELEMMFNLPNQFII